MAETLTPASIIARIPDEIVNIVRTAFADEDINTDLQDVKLLMPSSPVMAVIASHYGISKKAVETHELDQAKAWLDEQTRWQDRSMKVQRELSAKYPFDENEAEKGNVPSYMTQKWASLLLFQWSDSMRDAVIQAEEYLEETNE